MQSNIYINIYFIFYYLYGKCKIPRPFFSFAVTKQIHLFYRGAVKFLNSQDQTV